VDSIRKLLSNNICCRWGGENNNTGISAKPGGLKKQMPGKEENNRKGKWTKAWI